MDLNYTNINRHNKHNPSYKKAGVTFTGHIGVEKHIKNGGTWLRHETAFFREQEVKEYIKKYVEKNWKNKNEINIVSAGCSTGEEAITYSMLFRNMKQKVNILGFDLSADSIRKANSREYVLSRPVAIHRNQSYSCYSAFKDAYLAFPQDKLNNVQKKNKEVFKEYFQPVVKPSISYKQQLKTRLLNDFSFWNSDIPLENRYYRLKKDKAENCKFVVGDVEDINKILGGKKADIISFSNVMYHELTDDMCNIGYRTLKVKSDIILKNLIERFKESLVDGGLLVFGTNESKQMPKYGNVINTMKKSGFKPMNIAPHGAPCVWIKTGSKK